MYIYTLCSCKCSWLIVCHPHDWSTKITSQSPTKLDIHSNGARKCTKNNKFEHVKPFKLQMLSSKESTPFKGPFSNFHANILRDCSPWAGVWCAQADDESCAGPSLQIWTRDHWLQDFQSIQEISNGRTHVSRTPKKTKSIYSNSSRGPLVRSHSIFDGIKKKQDLISVGLDVFVFVVLCFLMHFLGAAEV